MAGLLSRSLPGLAIGFSAFTFTDRQHGEGHYLIFYLINQAIAEFSDTGRDRGKNS